MRSFVLFSSLMLTCTLFAQNGIFGRWVTVDENTGKKRSIIEITERGGKAFGRLLKIFPDVGEDPDPICKECDEDDDRFNQKFVGMEIMRDMVRNGTEWGDGTILDPEKGSVYDCKIWVEPGAGNEGKLKVRGYLMFFFRTQTWVRD
ncbi:MAG: DUF2147 domain-containing protein [Flavobacteriales bacterium]|nr:DUF2147 domain-containing protein [Flavobacteriales bacterium]